jgi:hypothetical protein
MKRPMEHVGGGSGPRHLRGAKHDDGLAFARAWRVRNAARFDALYGAESPRLCRMCRRPFDDGAPA